MRAKIRTHQTSSIFPLFRFRVHDDFCSRRIFSQIRDDHSSFRNQSSVNCSFESDFGFSRVCFRSCSWCTRLFVVLVCSSVSLFFILFSFNITCGSYSQLFVWFLQWLLEVLVYPQRHNFVAFTMTLSKRPFHGLSWQ